MGEPEEEQLNAGAINSAAERFIVGLQLPQMARPVGLGAEYSFPTDMRQLTGPQLGQLQMQLGAYYTWTIGVIGKEEAELSTFEAIYELRLNSAANAERARYKDVKGTITKEELKALAIEADPMLKKLTAALLLRKSKITRLEAQSKIYAEQVNRLSREQTRRDAEYRLPGA